MSGLDQARFSGIDYSRVPIGQSVYGEPQPLTLSLGAELWNWGDRVLFLAEGDGRYAVPSVLRGVGGVAVDTDIVALRRLRSRVDAISDGGRVNTVISSALATFPHGPESFDGVLSTGFLYLHPEDTILQVVHEVHRVLRPGKTFVAEMLTARTRTNMSTGELITGEGEVNYSPNQMRMVLEEACGNFDHHSVLELNLDTTYMVPRIGMPDVSCHLTGVLQILAATK